MDKCEVCGNDYERPFAVVMNGESHLFDCFECAIHALAPRCATCGCRVIGHGHSANGSTYCSAHCGHLAGHLGLVDSLEPLKLAR